MMVGYIDAYGVEGNRGIGTARKIEWKMEGIETKIQTSTEFEKVSNDYFDLKFFLSIIIISQ